MEQLKLDAGLLLLRVECFGSMRFWALGLQLGFRGLGFLGLGFRVQFRGLVQKLKSTLGFTV